MNAHSIEEMTIGDYDEVIALWQASKGVGLGLGDSRHGIARYLGRNPGTSFIARCDGSVVGAVLGGFDGRRGYLNHLAVAASHRGLGIGSELVERCMAAFKQMDVPRCTILVLADNADGIAFWRKIGWRFRSDILYASFDIDGE